MSNNAATALVHDMLDKNMNFGDFMQKCAEKFYEIDTLVSDFSICSAVVIAQNKLDDFNKMSNDEKILVVDDFVDYKIKVLAKEIDSTSANNDLINRMLGLVNKWCEKHENCDSKFQDFVKLELDGSISNTSFLEKCFEYWNDLDVPSYIDSYKTELERELNILENLRDSRLERMQDVAEKFSLIENSI